MNIISSHIKLGEHIRNLREGQNFTLTTFAESSGVSRATLSRIENGDVSPTAETLGRLASALTLPISQLLAPLEKGFTPLILRDAQSLWRDPQKRFERRNISPPNGQLAIELIEVELGAREMINYAAPSVLGQEHHIYLLQGTLTVTVAEQAHILSKGDCLRYKLYGATQFKTGAAKARYVLALS